MQYKVYANGHFLGHYTVPKTWGFNRVSTRLHRVALVAMRGDLHSVHFSK